MTALMVLFLVAMAVALMAVTSKISEDEKNKDHRKDDTHTLCNQLAMSVKDMVGVSVNDPGKGSCTIDFGDRARFDTDKNKLTDEQAKLLRAIVPKILELSRDSLGQKWFKRIIVEGFADQRGTYIHNLNLSLERAERVLCVLLASSNNIPDALSEQDRREIRELFLVGGSSFNSLKPGLEESRRIELKLEFLDIGESRPKTHEMPLDNDPTCPVD